jgi:hypothetical protein
MSNHAAPRASHIFDRASVTEPVTALNFLLPASYFPLAQTPPSVLSFFEHSTFCKSLICTPLLLEDSKIPPSAGTAVPFTTDARISGNPSLSKSPTLSGIRGDSFDVFDGCEKSKDVVPGRREDIGMLVKDWKAE